MLYIYIHTHMHTHPPPHTHTFCINYKYVVRIGLNTHYIFKVGATAESKMPVTATVVCVTMCVCNNVCV
jgi:hypothetical protein